VSIKQQRHSSTRINAMSAARKYVYLYTGGAAVPKDVTHVRVDESVTIISDRAFMDCIYLQEVELPDGILIIECDAFFKCNSLRRINIPSTVEEIGKRAFWYCEKLEEVVLPNGLQILGAMAFYSCKSLQRINIPPRVKTIESQIFYDCSKLMEVTLLEGLREIKGSVFRGCKSLVSVNLPSSLQVIGPWAFNGCASLTEMRLSDLVENIGIQAFEDCNFQSFHMPPLVTNVDMGIFVGHNCMVSLELPENVSFIETGSISGTELSSLRNIAVPSGFSWTLTYRISRMCKDLGNAFPDGDSTTISDALQQRFDGLPIHKICYYQSYHSTSIVLSKLRREINPWSSKFGGKLNATGKQQDCLGMTPLHILACSTKHDLEMYRLLVGKYPETLVMKDKWGDIPMLYAFWCNAPKEIIHFLVKSYGSIYPDYEFDWGGLLETLAKGRVPLATIQRMVNTQRNSFPDQTFDMENIVMELAKSDASGSKGHIPGTPIETFRYLLLDSISERLNSLHVRRWRAEIENCVNEFPEDAKDRDEDTSVVYSKLASYELLKEAAWLLELTLWKAKLNESISTNCQIHLRKKARVGDGVRLKEQCRISCGADVVVRNVLPFLWPK
jgi:hypothetical protein